jgi:hypothetical protein
VAFLALYDNVVIMPSKEEKEQAKDYMESITCPKW